MTRTTAVNDVTAGSRQTEAEPIRNVVPGKYRGVAVSRLPIEPQPAALTAHLMGKTAYRRTRFVVARHGASTAIARVWRTEGAGETLFAPITHIEVLAGPADCAYVRDPDCDTAVPSDLARAAKRLAPGAVAVAVEGMYEHVSFIIGPDPLRIIVREVAPPEPAKLLDQARRVLALAEDLPPIELVPDIVQLADVAAARPDADYLVPCRGSGLDVAGATTWYLDEHPPEHDWTLIGPERSQQIHESFYGRPASKYIDICPDNRPAMAGPLLAKCSLLENEIRSGDGQVTVPWGSSLAMVRRALEEIARYWEPSWEPI